LPARRTRAPDPEEDPRADVAERRRVLSVGELVGGLNALLEDRVGRVWVAGEISGLRRPSSGHLYFTLKDDRAQIRVALFRSAAGRVPFVLEDGLEVIAYADVQIYEARGDLQLIARQIEPLGRGALQLAFEQLKQRLAAEGLFEVARKRPLPAFPRRVGVVTSPSGAAVRDVIQVSGQRAPATPILIAPTRVQGAGAEHEIAAALAAIASQPEIDVVLLVRGGGSLEDLWSFNTEVVARAIADCPVPVLCGVGHETDVTIADLVADVRAPTPSAAALQALPDRMSLAAGLARDWRRLGGAVRRELARLRSGFGRERDALRMLAPATRLATQRRRLVSAHRALGSALRLRGERSRARLERLAAQLDGLSPLAVLGRGYALVQRGRDGAIVRAPHEVAPGEALRVRLAEGTISAVVTEEDEAAS
jgi:exodeoxyribonuclease VII large subunit